MHVHVQLTDYIYSVRGIFLGDVTQSMQTIAANMRCNHACVTEPAVRMYYEHHAYQCAHMIC